MALRKNAAGAKRKVSDDVDYVISLGHTLSVREGIREIITTLWEALILVIPGSIPFPPELSRHANPRSDGPVSLYRNLHLLSDA